MTEARYCSSEIKSVGANIPGGNGGEMTQDHKGLT